MVRILALFSIMIVVLFFGSGILKSDTRGAKQELSSVNRAILVEEEKIRVLKAEWAHRTEPETLRRLADVHLGLTRVRIEQIASIEDVPYLGMNLYDDEFEATPVNYAGTLRRKPSALAAVEASAKELAERHAALEPIEYVMAGPGRRVR